MLETLTETLLMDLTSLQHFHFLRPYWLLFFIAAVYVLAAFRLRDDSLGRWKKVMSPTIIKQLTVKGNNTHWLSPQKLSLILSIPICILLMGPTWQQQVSPFSENNSPLIIALDVSETMEQNDIQPSRLLRAKQKIIELLTLRGDTKTALIAFSGSAHIVMPMTNDREMIRHFLDVLTKDLLPVQGKLPETILPLVDKLLKSSAVPGTVLLIGDGATKNTVTAFSDFFTKQSDQLIVWGIGLIPSSSDSNESIIIPLQIRELKTLNSKSNGRFVVMTHDKQDIDTVNNYIEHNLVIVEDESRPWHDAGYPFIFIIAALFLFWFRKGWTLQW
jgi:Ca-activated chloride channel family protein